MSNDDLCARLRGLGVSESRLGAIGLGAPSTTAPAARTEPSSIFRAKYGEQRTATTEAERAAKKAALASMPDSAIERHAGALALFRQYRSANAIHRAHLRANYSTEIELGRQLDELEPPEPPKAA
jgi:hypothetical protein